MLIIVKGAGDLATGVAWRLKRCGYEVICTELAQPMAVRRKVAFSQAVYDGTCRVEGIEARLCADANEALELSKTAVVPVLVDPAASAIVTLRPAAVIDGILAKRNTGTNITDAPLVIALGPGFSAGEDCHCVIETKRGHTLGRCIWQGPAIANTGIPGNVGGYTTERVLKSPVAGTFTGVVEIGDLVEQGQLVARVEGEPVFSQIRGYVRGLLQDGVQVKANEKVGDVDARCVASHCHTISEKSLAIAGGCVEALLTCGVLPEPSKGIH